MDRVWVRSLLWVVAAGLALALIDAAESEEAADPIYQAPSEEAAPAQDVATTEIPHYQPPGIGAPKNRTSGGTRGGPAVGVELLAPADHVGITTSAQPTLYWHLTGSTQARVDFVLRDEVSTKPFIERTLPTPAGPGIQAVSLAELGVSLPIGVDYQWSISLVANDDHRARDIVATAWIRRVEASEALTERLAQGDTARAVFVYAENGIWYDAFRAASPAQRQGLLAEVGLGTMARAETTGEGPRGVLGAQ